MPVLVNDHVKLAGQLGADGAHVGQHDMSAKQARRQLDGLLLGVSTHDLQQLRSATAAGADYVGFGPCFPTATKGYEEGLPRKKIAAAATAAPIPLYAIGGIQPTHIADEYQVTARIWETQTMRQVAELTESGWDLYGTVDALSLEVRESLDVPQSSGRMAEDLPLAETYGESMAAFRNYIGGLNARLFDNDFEASNALFDAAVE